MSRNRALALALLCATQTIFFAHFRDRPITVLSDNARYEEAGFQLATHGRLLLPFPLMPDAVVRDWVCARHPDACVGDYYPTAAYPPGYSVFIAALYSVFGRSLAAIVITQYLLLLLLFVLFEKVAHRLLAPAGYWFAVAVAASYPFLARQASAIMSDHLHAVVLFAALSSFVLLRPAWWRGAIFGALFAAATLIRPYSIVCLPFIFLWPDLWRGQKADRREWMVAAAVGALPFIAWTLRNAYWFGHFIPLTTTGLGAPLFIFMMEWKVGGVYSAAQSATVEHALMKYGDPFTHGPNQLLIAEAGAWLHGHIPQALLLCLIHLPKVWISLGSEGQGVSRAALVIVPYLGALWILGVAGMWLTRRDRRFHLLLAIIVPYWMFVLPWFEARRTLPLRLPMLLLGAVAFEHLYRALLERRGRSSHL